MISHFLKKLLHQHQSLFLINIHPLLSPPATAEKSLCIPYKLRLGFILTVNLYVTDDRPRQFLVFFNENARCTNPPQIPCVFSGKMRLAFNVIVNSYDTRPTAPGFRIFFQLKRASRKPFQIPCVFSMKARRAFKVIVNVHVMRSTAPTFFVFFHRKCASQESCRIRWVHFPLFSRVIRSCVQK